jgi:hypothetical protein
VWDTRGLAGILDPSQSTFAYESTVKRWPRILTGIIDDLNKNFDACEGDKLSEAKKLISDIAALVNMLDLVSWN